MCLAGTLTGVSMPAARAAPSPIPGEPDAPAVPQPEASTPLSDKEETGSLTDILPDRVELFALPAADDDSPAASEDRALHSVVSLFPPELWPPVPGASADPGTSTIKTEPGTFPSGEAMTPELVASCFGSAPPPPLHDPLSLLAQADAASLRALLRDSLNARGSFQTSVVVLKPSQQIPVALNPPELLQRWYGRSKGLLILYFFGQPDRTQAFFTPESMRCHRSEELRQVIDFGVREAGRLTAAPAQLQRFCYKTVIRLDRLHRQGTITPAEEPSPAVAAVPGAGLWWAFAVGVQATALAGGGVWWWRRRRTGGGGSIDECIRFPEQDIVARLGAPHSGGFGAVIQFGGSGHRL